MKQATKKLYDNDAYLKTCQAQVIAIKDNGVVLSETIAYAASGGQPGDVGHIVLSSGSELSFVETVYDEDGFSILHQMEDPSSSIKLGETVTVAIDWQRRYTLMRMHSALHVLCGIVNEPVMGGGTNVDSSRIDFDLPNPIDKIELQQKLDDVIRQDFTISVNVLSKEEAQQGLDKVRTVGVKPTVSDEGLRVVKIAKDDIILDDQPCGGTHVKSTRELQGIHIKKIEKKNKNSRRIRIGF